MPPFELWLIDHSIWFVPSLFTGLLGLMLGALVGSLVQITLLNRWNLHRSPRAPGILVPIGGGGLSALVPGGGLLVASIIVQPLLRAIAEGLTGTAIALVPALVGGIVGSAIACMVVRSLHRPQFG